MGSFEASGSVQLTPAVVGLVVRTTDRLVVATVTYRLQTFGHVQVMANSTLEVLSTSTVQAVRHNLKAPHHFCSDALCQQLQLRFSVNSFLYGMDINKTSRRLAVIISSSCL